MKGVCLNRARIETHRLEALHGLGQRRCSRLAKEETAHALYDRIERAACRVGDDRPAGCHGLDRSDAEIVFAGKNERAAASAVLIGLGVVKPSHKSNVGTSHGLKLCALASVADYHERQPEAVERLHRQVDALIRNQARHDQKEIIRRAGIGTKAPDIHRWVDNV